MEATRWRNGCRLVAAQSSITKCTKQFDRMGIHINLAVVMHDWSRRHGLAGPSLTLGVQDISFNRMEYEADVGVPAGRCPQNDCGVNASNAAAYDCK